MEYVHLEFYKTINKKVKYAPKYGPSNLTTLYNKQNREIHSNNLNKSISHLERYYNAYFSKKKRKLLKDNISVEIPLLLQIDPASNIFDDLHKYGLEFICEDEDGFILVATNLDGIKLFKDKLSKFKSYDKKENKGSSIIAEIHSIKNEQLPNKRLSPYLLSLFPFDDKKYYVVDISIDCKGFVPLHITKQRKNETIAQYQIRANDEKQKKYAEWDEFLDKRADSFFEFLSDYSNEEYEILDQTTCDYTITDNIPESIDFRIRLKGKILTDITKNYPYVFEISEPDDIEHTKDSLNEDNIEEQLTLVEPHETDPVVCVIDSGIQEGHKYLEKAILNKNSTNYTEDRTLFDEVDGGGHGTRVAGKILYPRTIPTDGTYELPCWLISAKVLNKDCKIPENKIPASLYEQVVTSNIDIVKIYNSSINSSVPYKTKHMSSWAAQIDMEMYKRDILFIQSAGNINISYSDGFPCTGIQKHIDNSNNYPSYLYNSESSRIANPAQSLFALTVGSILGEVYNNRNLGIKSIENKNNAVSSFSRSGLGLWGSIKPEVVDIGGGLVVDSNKNVRLDKKTAIELIRKSPEGPAFAKDDIGTSYSTPIVSNLAAELQKVFPKNSALLYKTLIVHSAQWPTWINIDNLNDEQKLEIIRSYGYGIPDKNNALHNNQHKITFITKESMELYSQDARIHYIPIPESIRAPEVEKNIKITVTLCYTAKPRRTRLYKRGYLSTWLDWISINKYELPEDFEKRIFERDKNDNKNFKWVFDNNLGWGQIKGVQRSNSTTQKDWTYLKSYELEKYFAIAVRSHRGWDNDPYSLANYALAVTIEAVDSDISIYNEISTAVKAEIETENEAKNIIETEITI